MPGEHDLKRLDQLDQKIINELTSDARLPIATLAKRLSISRNAIRNRIDRLESIGVISGYTLRLGEIQGKLDKTIALIMVYRKDRMRGAEVTTALKKIPEVRSCFVLSGSFDLVVQVEADNPDRLREICSDIWKIPGVEDTRTTFVLSTVLDRR